MLAALLYVLVWVAMIPFGLGMLVLVPVIPVIAGALYAGGRRLSPLLPAPAAASDHTRAPPRRRRGHLPGRPALLPPPCDNTTGHVGSEAAPPLHLVPRPELKTSRPNPNPWNQASTQLPSSRGWVWLREGLQVWRRNPALLTFAAFGYLLVLVLVSVFPLHRATRRLAHHARALGRCAQCLPRGERRAQARAGCAVFRLSQSNLPALIAIGGIYLVGTLVVLMLVSLVDDGTLMEAMRGGQIDEAAAADATRLASRWRWR